MADPRDARIAELEAQLAASEAQVEILRQVLAIWDALAALIQELQRGGPQPLTCHMAARLV